MDGLLFAECILGTSNTTGFMLKLAHVGAAPPLTKSCSISLYLSSIACAFVGLPILDMSVRQLYDRAPAAGHWLCSCGVARHKICTAGREGVPALLQEIRHR